MSNNKQVFIDESGDEGLGDGSSDYYVVLALIVEEEKYSDLLRHFKGVKGRHFKNIEMKSSVVQNDVVKRKQVISDITGKDFELSILVVDKRKLNSPGFHYSPSFIKYLHLQLYQNIISDSYSVHINADNIKSKAFMEEFKTYINKRKTLFSKWKFSFLDSRNNECIQATDFLCGTIRRCVEKDETSENRNIFLSHIKNRSHIEFFPYNENDYLYETTGTERSTYDIKIERKAIEIAYRYIEGNINSPKVEIQEQIHTLQFLLSDYHLSNGENWVPTWKLKEKHHEAFSAKISDQKIRSVIGKLRDKEVLIVSRRSGGYKIPTKESELYEYLSTQNMTVTPMVARIKKAHDLVRRATDENVNILEKPEFSNLKRIVEAVTQIDFD